MNQKNVSSKIINRATIPCNSRVTPAGKSKQLAGGRRGADLGRGPGKSPEQTPNRYPTIVGWFGECVCADRDCVYVFDVVATLCLARRTRTTKLERLQQLSRTGLNLDKKKVNKKHQNNLFEI